jgi:hypothetical protein
MAFNINNFAANISRFGTLQTNKFEIEIKPRLASWFAGYSDLNILTFRADSIRVPGYVMDTYEAKRYGIGPSQRTATNVRFEPISMEFIETSYGDISKFFYQWSNYIFNTSTENEAGGQTYKTQYKDTYIADITIKVFNNWGVDSSGNNKEVLTIDIAEAFPINVTDNNLSWGNNNTLYKVNVGFAFSYFQKRLNFE